MSFIVSGLGHSGTKFLAKNLATAEGWTVFHEPSPSTLVSLANRRFSGNKKYGEVNSRVLGSILSIKADKRAVIVRNPYDLFYSYVMSTYLGKGAIDYVLESMAFLHEVTRRGVLLIRFEYMISDVVHLLEIGQQLGVDNLVLENLSLEKENSHAEPIPREIKRSMIPQSYRDDLDYYCDLFQV